MRLPHHPSKLEQWPSDTTPTAAVSVLHSLDDETLKCCRHMYKRATSSPLTFAPSATRVPAKTELSPAFRNPMLKPAVPFLKMNMPLFMLLLIPSKSGQVSKHTSIAAPPHLGEVGSVGSPCHISLCVIKPMRRHRHKPRRPIISKNSRGRRLYTS